MPFDVTVELEGLSAGLEVATAPLSALIESVLASEGVEDGAGLTLLLTGDERLQALNREHRGVDAPTDVLSFPADDYAEPEEGGDDPSFALEDRAATTGQWPAPDEARYLGDIAVSVPLAHRQALEAGLAPDLELAHLVLHGVLHLLGYDHQTPEDDTAMRAQEEAVLGPAIHASRAHADE